MTSLETPPAPPFTPPPLAGGDGGGEEVVNLLLVDDQAEGLTALEAILAAPDRRLIAVRSGREALRHLLDSDFAVILLDVRMPGMNGYDLAALIRQRERSRTTPIIFLTAHSRAEAEVFRGYEVGAVDYVFKPVPPVVLRSKVAVFLALYRQTGLVRRQAGELERALHQLEELLEQRQVFASVVAHDLRAPLAIIRAAAQRLLDAEGSAPTVERSAWLRTIVRRLGEMDRLIRDLLDYSRIDRGLVGERETLDLAELVRVAAGDFAASGLERGVAVRREVPEGAVHLVGAPDRIGQVLGNLLANSTRFAAREVVVRLRPADDGGWVRLEVEDDGPGIPPAALGDIFARAGKEKLDRKRSRTGLGLSIVRAIVEEHGGWVAAENREGDGGVVVGARFTVGLPAGDE